MKTIRFFLIVAALAVLAPHAFAQTTPAPYWRVAGQIVTLSADTTASVGDSLYNSPLQFDVLANHSYWFEAHLLDSSSSTAGIKLALSYPDSNSIMSARLFGRTSGATASAYSTISVDTVAESTAYSTEEGTVGQINIYGALDVGPVGGKVILQFLKVTSGKGVLLKYSQIRWGRSK